MIEVENLTRVFRTYRKQPGFWGGVKGLFRREFEEVRAADGISFTIGEGEFVGFLGPNGAGKTTTLKMLSGLIFPTSGRARVAGFDPTRRENAYRRIFALVLGQKNQLWWDLPAIESFLLLRHIYGVPADRHRATLDELLDLLAVRDKVGVMVRELSLGERMKMELIAALLHRPRVLFLDEPTIGLDVVSQKAVRSFLRDYNRRYRTTILLTSHYMADIKELCERVIVIHKGKKIHDGDIGRLDATGSRQKIIKFRPALHVLHSPALRDDGGSAVEGRLQVPAAEAAASGAFAEIDRLPGIRVDRTAEGGYVLHVPTERAVAVSQQILAAGPVADITIEDVPLEDIIAELFGKQG